MVFLQVQAFIGIKTAEISPVCQDFYFIEYQTWLFFIPPSSVRDPHAGGFKGAAFGLQVMMESIFATKHQIISVLQVNKAWNYVF